MSLLPTTHKANETTPYFIENIGGNGVGLNPVPCMKAGSVFNAMRIGNVSTGMVLIGGSGASNPLVQGLRGGYPDAAASGSSVVLGASAAAPQNIVLTDALTTINTSVNIAAAGADLTVADQINVGGNLFFTNGGTGSSVSGYYQVNAGTYNVPDPGTVQIANPVGLTTGWYIVSCSAAPGGQRQEQPATLVRFTVGAGYLVGGSCSSSAGAGRFALNPSDDRQFMVLENSTGVAQNNITVFFSKIAA